MLIVGIALESVPVKMIACILTKDFTWKISRKAVVVILTSYPTIMKSVINKYFFQAPAIGYAKHPAVLSPGMGIVSLSVTGHLTMVTWKLRRIIYSKESRNRKPALKDCRIKVLLLSKGKFFLNFTIKVS
jgi:hypothetical protein